MIEYVLYFLLFFVLLLGAATLVGHRIGLRFNNLGIEDVVRFANDLLVYGEDFETIIVESESAQKFVQFKKYIESANCYGVELVFPLTGVYSRKSVEVDRICKKFDLTSVKVPTPHGWPYIFVEISKGRNIDTVLISEILRICDFLPSDVLRVGTGSSFKWNRKTAIYGNQRLSTDRVHRHSVRFFDSEM